MKIIGRVFNHFYILSVISVSFISVLYQNFKYDSYNSNVYYIYVYFSFHFRVRQPKFSRDIWLFYDRILTFWVLLQIDVFLQNIIVSIKKGTSEVWIWILSGS